MSIEELKSTIEAKKKELATLTETDEKYADLSAEVIKLEGDLASAENKGGNENKDDIEAIIEERLAKMKSNMDRMSKERDEALKLKAELEKKAKEEQLARLKEEGKVQEALEMELAEAKAKLDLYQKDITSLRRDSVVNDALASLDFRNEKSREMARREITDELIQNEEGMWVHKSGTPIKDFIVAYSKNDDNSFLFKVKSNSGAGTSTNSGTPNTDGKKAIGEMTTQEILALAAKGQLGKFGF